MKTLLLQRRRVILKEFSVSNKLKNFENKCLILFFVAVVIIAFFFPPSADDLGWATSQGLNLLENKFEDYNGRYLGNIFAIIFARNPVLLPFIKSITLTSLLKLIQVFSSNKSKEFLLLSSLFLIIPTPLFIQSFVWTAGFSNYCFSILIIMLGLYIVLNNNKLSKFGFFLKYIFIVMLSISGQLFMETFSIFLIVLSVFLNVISIIKNKKIDIFYLTYMISCFIGSIIMFSNSVYLKIYNGENTYQSLSVNHKSLLSTLWKCVENLLSTVSLNFIFACFPTIVFILIYSVLLYKLKGIERKENKYIFKYFTLLTVVSILILLLAALVTKKANMLKMLAGLILLYIILFCSIVVREFKNKNAKNKTLIYLVIIILQCLPLVVVSPIGPRCFSGTYIVSILIAKEFWDEYSLFKKNTQNFSQLKIAKILLAFLLAINLFCYSQVYMANNRKIEYIRSEIKNGNYTIELNHTSFRFMVYALDVEYKNSKFLQRFCEYYQLPTNIEIIYK